LLKTSRVNVELHDGGGGISKTLVSNSALVRRESFKSYKNVDIAATAASNI
jgi:hypothetical protein